MGVSKGLAKIKNTVWVDGNSSSVPFMFAIIAHPEKCRTSVSLGTGIVQASSVGSMIRLGVVYA